MASMAYSTASREREESGYVIASGKRGGGGELSPWKRRPSGEKVLTCTITRVRPDQAGGGAAGRGGTPLEARTATIRPELGRGRENSRLCRILIDYGRVRERERDDDEERRGERRQHAITDSGRTRESYLLNMVADRLFSLLLKPY